LESEQEAGHLKHLARLTGWDGAVGMYTAEVVASARQSQLWSIERQSVTAVWKSCVAGVDLMEEVVEELAPRLPYPLLLC
jgi:hypothetical protein